MLFIFFFSFFLLFVFEYVFFVANNVGPNEMSNPTTFHLSFHYFPMYHFFWKETTTVTKLIVVSMVILFLWCQ